MNPETLHVIDAYESVAAPLMTEWENHREREEFAKASKLYGPLSSIMASRFTRGGLIDDQQSATLEKVFILASFCQHFFCGKGFYIALLSALFCQNFLCEKGFNFAVFFFVFL
jgi:hypothetical protein